MYTTELSHEGHRRRFILGEAPLGGWELRVEEDQAVVSRVRYTDWHRVERALGAVERRVSELEAGGWRVESITNHESLILESIHGFNDSRFVISDFRKVYSTKR